jgi:hypothetical protein
VARARLRAHPRFHRHFMPPGSSWLDLAGCRFGLLTGEQRFRRGFRKYLEVLGHGIRA